MKVILASKSPRRKEILSMITKEFDVVVSDEEEIIDEKLDIYEQAKSLAYTKAKSVFDRLSGDRIVIGSDTMVVDLDGKIYGKPKDREDAFGMISMLSGRTHSVFTGVTVIKNGVAETFFVKSDVTFYELSEGEINNYLDSGEYADKAGSYGIQGKGCILVKEVQGDYFNIVGLPIARTYRAITQ